MTSMWFILIAVSFLIITVKIQGEEELCDCACDYYEKVEAARTNNLTQQAANLTRAEKAKLIGPKLEETKKSLRRNATETSSSKAKKISARDDRQSSANLGYLGIALLTLVPGLMVVIDLMSLSTHLGVLRRNLNLQK